MIINKLSDLDISIDTRKTKVEVFESKFIVLTYLPDKGYALFLEDEPEDSMFLVQTQFTPEECMNKEEHSSEYDRCVHIVDLILNEIYVDVEIKEYEKKHPEYVYIELMDNIQDSTDIVQRNSDLYLIVDKGFLKMDLYQLTNSLNQSQNDVVTDPNDSSNLDTSNNPNEPNNPYAPNNQGNPNSGDPTQEDSISYTFEKQVGSKVRDIINKY